MESAWWIVLWLGVGMVAGIALAAFVIFALTHVLCRDIEEDEFLSRMSLPVPPRTAEIPKPAVDHVVGVDGAGADDNLVWLARHLKDDSRLPSRVPVRARKPTAHGTRSRKAKASKRKTKSRKARASR